MMMQFPNTLPLGIQGSTIDPMRVVLLLIEVAFIVFGLHLAFKFLKNYRTMNNTVRGSRMFAAWGWLFFSYALMKALILLADFYMLNTFFRDMYITFGYMSSATGALFFIYNIESVGVIKSRHIFTIVFLVIYAIQVVLVSLFISAQLITFNTIQNFATLFWVPIILLFLIYLFKVNMLARGKLKTYSILMILGIIIMIFGYFGATDSAIRNFGGLPIRLVADIFSIIGIGMVGSFFLMMPSWREIEWRPALESMFVVRKGGICIYEHYFMQHSKNDDTASMMIGSALEMIKALLQQATTEELKVLDFKDKKLLIEQGEKVMVVMIANFETESLNFLLHLFLTRFERFFHDILSNWRGDLTEFEPAKALIQEIFD